MVVKAGYLLGSGGDIEDFSVVAAGRGRPARDLHRWDAAAKRDVLVVADADPLVPVPTGESAFSPSSAATGRLSYCVLRRMIEETSSPFPKSRSRIATKKKTAQCKAHRHSAEAKARRP